MTGEEESPESSDLEPPECYFSKGLKRRESDSNMIVGRSSNDISIWVSDGTIPQDGKNIISAVI